MKKNICKEWGGNEKVQKERERRWGGKGKREAQWVIATATAIGVLQSSRARWKNGSCDSADAHGPVCARPAMVLLIAAGDAGTVTCAAAPRPCPACAWHPCAAAPRGCWPQVGRTRRDRRAQRYSACKRTGPRATLVERRPLLARQPHSCARLTVSAAPASVLQGPGSLRRQRQRP